MAGRGPAPKRESQRRRQNKPKRPVDHLDGAVPPPDLAIEVHPLAQGVYDALKNSPEAAYLTPAAWQRARVSTFVLSEQLLADKMSAVMYTALQQDWKALLIDPAELRRLGIEVRKAPTTDPDEQSAVTALHEFRASRSG
jgi:hypothetical protein